MTSNNYEVINVSSNTPAEMNGFKIGDILLSINNIGIENFKGLSSIIDLMSKSAGTTYNITISRNGVKMELSLELEDIYK
jgi:S1-C subfamily serine protease